MKRLKCGYTKYELEGLLQRIRDISLLDNQAAVFALDEFIVSIQKRTLNSLDIELTISDQARRDANTLAKNTRKILRIAEEKINNAPDSIHENDSTNLRDEAVELMLALPEVLRTTHQEHFNNLRERLYELAKRFDELYLLKGLNENL